jgi:hypothetical protein
MSQKLMTANFMEALLRAALILGEKPSGASIREITISALMPDGQAQPQCRITMEKTPQIPGLEQSFIILFPDSRAS